jgi:hypothetical protein
MEDLFKNYGFPGILVLLFCYAVRWIATEAIKPLTAAVVTFIQQTAENNDRLNKINEDNAVTLRILADNCPGRAN